MPSSQTKMEYEKMKLKDALTRYLNGKAYAPQKTIANLTYRCSKLIGTCERSKGTFHLDPAMPMSSLRTSHVAQLRDARLAEGLKPASINAEIACLQRVYTLCRDEWDVKVAALVRFSKLRSQPKTRYLSDSELAGVRAMLYGQPRALFEVLVGSGIRLGEALGLEPENYQGDSIEVYRSKTRTMAKVVLSKKARDALGSSPKKFTAKDVRCLRSAIDAVCNRDRRRERATIHSLRDTFATRLVMRGMSLYQVSRLLGHSSLSMTTKYAHLETGGLVNEARRLIDES